MTDDDLKKLAEQLAADEKLRPHLDKAMEARRNFFFSENFKWLSVTILIPLATFIFGYWQNQQTAKRISAEAAEAKNDRDFQREIENIRSDVSAMTTLLPALSDTDPDKVTLAGIVLDQLKLIRQDKRSAVVILSNAVEKRVVQLRDSNSESDRLRAAEQREKNGAAAGQAPQIGAAEGKPIAPNEAKSAQEVKPKIVFLQIYTAEQRGLAVRSQQLFRSEGVGAPGIDDIVKRLGGKVATNGAEIRYFTDDDLGAAAWTANQLATIDKHAWRIVRVQAKWAVPPGQIEVWWPSSGQ